MCLLLTVLAAAASLVVWYLHPRRKALRLDWLCWMYGGAALMWAVDAAFELAEGGAEVFFQPPAADMLNDAYLGASAVALGLLIWAVGLLARDPDGVLRPAARKA